MLKRFLFAFALACGLAVVGEAQIAVPNTLVSGHTILSGDLNTNFSTISNHALDRLSGGNISGNVTVDPGITIDGIDIGATVCPTCAPTFKDLTLATPATGLTVNGNVIVNSTGKIPALTSTYFTSLAYDAANLTGTAGAINGAAITALNAANLTGTAAAINGSAITALNGSNIATGTVAPARLGASPTSATFLRGDGTWSTTTTVLTSTATGTQNDFSLALSANTVVRLNNASLLTISGFGGGAYADGDRVRFISIGAGQVDFLHQSTNSSAGNRMVLFATSGPTSLAPGVGIADFVYDATTTRWRLVQHEQGAPITPAFAAGNFIGTSSMTWTVQAGDVITMSYYLHGRELLVAFYLQTTTVGGTPSTGLVIGSGTWGGFIAAKNAVGAFAYTDNGAGQTPGTMQIGAAQTQIQLLRAGVPSWTAATDNTGVFGQMTIEVQ